jgi:hypothetical protein
MSYLLEQMRVALAPDLPPVGLDFAPPNPATPDLDGLWMTEHLPVQAPLADRVEQFVARQLEAGSASAEALSQATYAAFPGWQTPDAALLAACLESYGHEEGGLLHLRPEDQPQNRNDDLASIVRLLRELGEQLGYQVWGASLAGQPVADSSSAAEAAGDDHATYAPATVVWQANQEPAFAFAVVAQAVVRPWLASPPEALASCPRYVALPGGRAGLLDFKLRRCPPWRARLAWTGWEFVKFRHLRELAGQPGLSLASFRARIGLDPIVTLPGQQLALFDIESQGDSDAA